ncbi:MAG: PEP-CTERM sorting domain-containing protein, partial [Planctomycetales bacterium]|nr:PEP-CTERM sorting domain-containing protein [Planctomycetales bacterium]
DINGDTWGWTLGRGRYGTSDDPTQNHTDRWEGYIDEVRISNVALAQYEFLFATIPEPSTAVLLGLALIAAATRRRRSR